MLKDPWLNHLSNYNLLELNTKAEKVGYRIRVANGYTFDFEYQGGLSKYYQSGYAVKTFNDTNEGRDQALKLLNEVSKEITNVRMRLMNE